MYVINTQRASTSGSAAAAKSPTPASRLESDIEPLNLDAPAGSVPGPFARDLDEGFLLVGGGAALGAGFIGSAEGVDAGGAAGRGESALRSEQEPGNLGSSPENVTASLEH